MPPDGVAASGVVAGPLIGDTDSRVRQCVAAGGHPAWCELAEDDPRKWAAVLDGAQHWALRLETRQQALAQASRDIAAEGEWSSLATRLVRGRGPAYIPRHRRATVR